MKVFKRIFTSIKRKPQQSILMFLIVFMLGNVLFASIAIKQASENVRYELRARIPSNLIIEQVYGITDEENERMTKFYEELKENEHVKKAVLQASFISPSLEYLQTGEGFSEILNMIESIEDYQSNNFIEEGRFFTQEELDNGSNKIVLSYGDYKYELNHEGKNYKIGDVYRIYLYDYQIVTTQDYFGNDKTKVEVVDELPYIDYEIIGYFKEILDDSVILSSSISIESVNQYFQKQTNILESHSNEDKLLLDSRKVRVADTEINKITIYTKGVDANEILEKEIRESNNYINSSYKINSSEADYRYIEAPLENLLALTNVALIGSIIMIVLLLSLISMLFIRNRTKEIGILMALGEKKSKIILQFVAEIVFVGLLATSFSMVSGQQLGSYISEEFMRIQIDADAEIEYAEDNPDEITRLDLLETYQVEMDVNYIIQIYISSFFILTISSIIPIRNILRINPKQTLL